MPLMDQAGHARLPIGIDGEVPRSPKAAARLGEHIARGIRAGIVKGIKYAMG